MQGKGAFPAHGLRREDQLATALARQLGQGLPHGSLFNVDDDRTLRLGQRRTDGAEGDGTQRKRAHE